MNWLGVTKSLLGMITSIGVGNIVGNVVKATTPANLNTFNKITIQVGTFVISGLVATHAVNYVNSEIDSIAAQISKKDTESTSQK